jgi:hypothetical protein
MAPGDPLQTREAGLRKLILAKRWIVASSVTLTGVLAAVAANAFPGKTIKTASEVKSERGADEASSPAEPSSGEGSSGSLAPPEEAPQSGAEPEGESEPSAEAEQAAETPVISGGS